MSWDGKTRGSVLGHRIFVFLLDKCGLGFAYVLLAFVAMYFFVFYKKSRQSVYYLFHNRLGNPPLKAFFNTYKNLFAFGQNLIDKVAIMSGQKSRYSQNHDDGGQYLDQMTAAGRGGILMSGHIGNFEVGGQLLERLGSRINVIMHDADHQKMKDYVDSVTEKKSFNVIAIKDDLSHVIHIKNALANNEFICVHGDRFMAGADVIEKEFLGEKAFFPKGPFIIATRFGAPVTFVFVLKKGRRFYKFSATPPKIYNRDIEGVMDDYIAELERKVKENPTQWFNHYHFWQKLQA